MGEEGWVGVVRCGREEREGDDFGLNFGLNFGINGM